MKFRIKSDTVKKICIPPLVTITIYAGKRAIDEGIKAIKESLRKRKSRKAMVTPDSVTENLDEMIPSETLNEVLSKSDSKRETELVDNFLYKGDTCLICARPNVGKSILTMQIGLAIAEGENSKLTPICEKQKILPQVVYYYDGEMRNSDIRHRFRRGMDKYPKTFLRVRDNNLNSLEKLINDIRRRVTNEHPNEDCTVAIDNIASFSRNKSKNDVGDFFKALNALKEEYENRGNSLTVLIVIHTIKTHNKYTPIELEDIAEAAEFSRFTNSIIALEECRLGKNKRILKSLKYKYDAIPEEVSIVNLMKDPELHFEYECSMLEEDAILLKKWKKGTGSTRPVSSAEGSTPADDTEQSLDEGNQSGMKEGIASNPSPKDRRKEVTPEILLRMKQMHDEGMTQEMIGKSLNLSRKTVNKYLQQIKRREI